MLLNCFGTEGGWHNGIILECNTFDYDGFYWSTNIIPILALYCWCKHINSKYEMYKSTAILSISYCKIYESRHLTFK